MNDWVPIALIVLAFVVIIGNFSTFQKSAKTPLRKKSLNDLEETLPRTNKTDHKLPSIKQKNSS